MRCAVSEGMSSASCGIAQKPGVESDEEPLVDADLSRTRIVQTRVGRRVWMGCACNILNGTLGPGMLVLPRAFHRTGLAFGSFLVLVIWCFSYLALILLLEACARMHTSNLVMLGRMHSPVMSRAIDFSVLLYFYGTCISYLILVGGTFSALLQPFQPTASDDDSLSTWFATRGGTILLVIAGVAVMLPLSCSRSMDKLGGFSSLIVLLYTFITIVVWSCHASNTSEPQPVMETYSCLTAHSCVVHHGWPLIRAMPTIAYCFSSQAVYPPALETIRSHSSGYASRKISRLLTDYTFGLTLLAYLLVGVGGHVAVRGSPPANVLNAYEPSIAIALAQIALICALSISYPLMFVVARLHFFSLTTRYIDADRHHNVISTSGVVLSLLVAICFPMVENVLGLLGATSSVSLSFVVPAMLYQKYVLQVKPQNSIAFASWVPKALIAFGLILAVLSIPVQVFEMTQTLQTPSRASHVFLAAT